MNSLRRQLTRALLGTLAVLLGAALAGIYLVVWDELVDAFMPPSAQRRRRSAR